MRATMYVNPDDPVTHKPKVYDKSEASRGLSLPYVAKDGFPVFTFEGEPTMTDFQAVNAVPGMVGRNMRGELFLIDADGEAHKVPLTLISEREHERLLKFKESHRAEAA